MPGSHRPRARRGTDGALLLAATLVVGAIWAGPGSAATSQDPTSTTAPTVGSPTSPPPLPVDDPPAAPPISPPPADTPGRSSSTTAAPGARRPSPTTTVRPTDLPPPVAPVVVVDDPRVLPELGAVGLDSPDYNRTVADYVATQGRLQEQVDTYERAVRELRDLVLATDRLEGEQVQATRRRDKAAGRLAELRAELRDLAVRQYVEGGLGGPVEESLDLAGTTEQGRRRVLVDAVQGDRLGELRVTVDALARSEAAVTSTTAELDEVIRRRTENEAIRDAAAIQRDRLTIELGLRRRAVADTRLLASVVGLDFPLVVLNAYVKAAKILAVTQPECGIRWQALAGIGRTESRHGTYNDSQVDADGVVAPPIYGIALTGSGGTAAISDSDLGLLDGDPTVDRAVGPMQFIPTTWVSVARDASGDGRADPQNLYDAALTAGVYLCKKGPGLDTDAGMRRGFLSYNQDGSYVELVLDRTHGYDEFEIPPVPGAPVLPAPPPRPTAAPGDDGAGRAPTGGSTTTALDDE